MDPEIGCDLLQGHPLITISGHPHDIVAELPRVRLGHDNILSGPSKQASTDVTPNRGRPDRERKRYSVEHRLVRANSIGDWVNALDELVSGPTSQLMVPDAAAHKRELTQRWGPDGPWQFQAVSALHEVCRCADRSFESIPGKVPMQRWFQWFAWLRNRTRGHGAPTGRQCADMAHPLEESLRTICHEMALLQQPWAFLRRNLTGKYRVIPLVDCREDFDHLKREDHHQLRDGIYISIDGELRPVPFIFSDVDLSDFFVANGNFKGSTFEAISYLTDDLRAMDGSDYLLPASALPASGTAAAPLLDLRGESFTNLPPPIEGYVDRPTLEAELSDLLLDDRHRTVTLVGRGGVGKTSLALEVLERIAQTGEYFAIIWFSARGIDLLAHGAKSVQADVLTQSDMAGQFVELMNPAGSASKSFDDEAYLAGCLSGSADDGPFLVVFDNFETVRNPVDVFNFIDANVRNPNKVLVTTRFHDFKGDYPLKVGGMTRDEFATLVDSTAARLGVQSAVSDDYLERLYEEADGHPYVAKMLLGEVALTGHLGSIEKVMARREDILDALFERTFSNISPAAQRVFLTLSTWKSSVPRVAIEAALLRPANERIDVDKELDVLARSSLIEIVGPWEDPSGQFIHVPLAAAVFGRRKLTVNSMKTAIDADSEVMQMFGASKITDADKGLDPRISRVVSSLARKLQNDESIEDGMRVLELVATRYPPTWLRVADLAEEFPASDDRNDRVIDALRSYLEDQPQDARVWLRLADAYARTGEALGEIHARLQIAQLSTAAFVDVSNAANRFNCLLANGELTLQPGERPAMAELIRSLLEQRLSEADATAMSRLAWLCLHIGDEVAARDYTQRGLDMEPYNRHCLSLAERLGLDSSTSG